MTMRPARSGTRASSFSGHQDLWQANRGSDQDVSDRADERSEGCIAKRKRRVLESATPLSRSYETLELG
jgi:hypothetical protein